MQQLYTAIVDVSRNSGGELSIRMNFILDEFANFTKIDTFQSMLTVSRGRNCRFMIALQSFAQLEEKYGKEGAQNILDNGMLMYLKSNSIETATKISDKLGTYSVQSYGESSNTNIKYDNSSSSMSLISRKMLTPDEVLRIESPVILVMIAGECSAILYVPDISRMYFNKLNGMGTKEENRLLRIQRENERKIRKIGKVKIWDIWNEYKNNTKIDFEDEELEGLRENLRVSIKRKENIERKEKMDKDDI